MHVFGRYLYLKIWLVAVCIMVSVYACLYVSNKSGKYKVDIKKVIYQCCPNPEFSIIKTKPLNMLRIIPRPRVQLAPQEIVFYVDVPFSWVMLDRDKRYVCLKKYELHSTDSNVSLKKNRTSKQRRHASHYQIDWSDPKKRPMRYTYRYLYASEYGVLLPGSDGRPVSLTTSLPLSNYIDPIVKKNVECVSAYDYISCKDRSLEWCKAPRSFLDEHIGVEIPFLVDKPSLQVDKALKMITCIYPEKNRKKNASAKKHIVFKGVLPEHVDVSTCLQKNNMQVECALLSVNAGVC